MTEAELMQLLAAITPPDDDARAAAHAHWASLAKPLGGLGALETMLEDAAALTGTAQFDFSRRAVAVLCADNGVVAQGVSQTDQSVTRAVAENLAARRTSVCRMAQAAHCDVLPVDMGIAGAPVPGVRDCRVAAGTADFTKGPAMTRAEAVDAIGRGIALTRQLAAEGYGLVATGEMGIGNTTPTSALFSAYLGLPVEETVGRGAGLSDEGLERKRDCVRRALRRVGIELDAEREASLGDDRPVDSTQMFMPSGAPDPASKQAWQCGDDAGMAAKTRPCRAKQLLFELGGLEIATMAGMFLGAVEEQIPIVIDGAISTAAALAASRICEEEKAVADVTLASHVSKDGAARKALEALGLRAIIDADMSLGEGSGAVLLIPMLDAALAVYRGMGSFDDIHVDAYHRFK